MSEQTSEVLFAPAEKRGAVLDLTPLQWIVLGSAAFVSAIILLVFPAALTLLISLVLVGVACLVTLPPLFGGRTAIDWVPDISGYGGRLLRGKTYHRPVLTHKVSIPDQSPVIVDEIAEGPLSGYRFFSASTSNGNAIGVVHRAGAYTIVVEGEGKSFDTLDTDDQESLVNRWGTLLASMSREYSTISAFQWIEIGLPADPKEPEKYLDENAVLEKSHPARESLEDLITDAGPGARDHRTYLALQIGKGASKAIRTNGGGDAGASAVLSRQLSWLTQSLSDAEIEVTRVLTAREIAAVIYVGFDSGHIQTLGALQRSGAEAGISPSSLGKITAEEHWDAYHAGDWHVTGWIAEYPRTKVGVDFLSNLIYFSSAARRISITFAPSSPVAAMRRVDRMRYDDEANKKIREHGGFITSSRRRKQYEAAERHEDALSEGEAMAEFAGYVTVSASTFEEVEAAWEELTQSAASARIELRRMKGRQAEGFRNTLPLGSGLK